MAKKYTADIIEATSITGSLLGTATLASALVPGDKTVEGDLTVTGKITAEEFHTEFVSSSIVYKSGSTKFGDSSDDVMSVTGSLQVQGSITGSLLGTATNAVSSSYAVTSSYAHFAATPTVQGVQGTQGIQGVQGLQGADGYIGVDGTQGTQGVQGTTGTQGTQGTQGVQGIAGDLGGQGTQGTQGIQGITGTQGLQGRQGTTGTQGTSGTNGVQGTTGSQGTTGQTGSQGTTGQTGSQGTTGQTGSQGTTGTTGAQGTTGTTGSQGTTGTTGSQGTTGTTGSQGTTGTTGAQGTTGQTGSQGTTGQTGAQGTTGQTGSQGTTGTTGSQGTTGTQGIQGVQGVQGSTAGTATYVTVQDTRSTSSTPATNNMDQGVRFDFKANSTNGLSDGGSYNGTMYFRPYGSTSDWSGGGAHEIGFTANGSLHHRYGTTSWGSWYKILDSNNYNSYAPTLTGGNASGTWGISITGNAGSVTYSPNRNDAAAYPVLWGAAYTNSIGTIAYSAAAVTIQSSTGTLNATNLAATTRIDAPIYYDSDNTAYYVNPASATRLNGYLSFGIPGNGANANGRWLSIEGNTDVDGEGSGRLFFTEHNSTTGAMDSYGLSIGYRGGATSVTTAGGNTWTGLSAIDNGAWGFWGHNGDNTGTLAMYGPRTGAYIAATGDFRAPIFYDSNDTGFYTDPASTSNLNKLRITSAGNSSGGNILMGPAGEGTNKWSYLTGTHYNATSQAQGISVIGLYASSVENTISIGGNIYECNPATEIRFYTHNAITHSTGGSTRMVINSAGNVEANVDMRAPIFYDSNNTAYYLDPTSTSYSSYNAGGARFRNIEISNSTYTDTIQNVSSGGNIWLNFGHNGNVGLAYGGGYTTAYQSMRSPIFYDSDNTGYYVNPSGGSYLRGVLEVTGGHYDTEIRLTANAGDLGSGVSSAMSWWVSEPNVTWNEGGFGYNVTNDAGTPNNFGRLNTSFGQAYMRFTTGGHMYFYNTNTSGTRSTNMEMYSDGYVYANNYLVAGNSLRAPIFYDSNNTGYYADLNSTGTSINMAGSINAATYNKPAILVNSSGTSSSGAAIGMQQITGEGWTGIFVDFEPYTGWGLYHDNPNNYFCVTSESSTGSLRSFTVPSRQSGDRTAHEKIRFDQGNGSILAGGDITAFSDARVKSNVEVIDNAIKRLKAIRGVTFTKTNSEGKDKDKRHAGVLAQEVLEVLPEVVSKDQETGMYSVAYGNLAGLFIEAIKEQQTQIENQQSQIDELKSLVKQLLG